MAQDQRMHREHESEMIENAAWINDVARWRREMREALAIIARAEAVVRSREMLLDAHNDVVERDEQHMIAHENAMQLHRQAQSHGGLDMLDVEHEHLETDRPALNVAHHRFGTLQRQMMEALRAMGADLKDCV